MNWSANTTVTHRPLFAFAAHCSQDWEIARCPLALMFDLFQSGARLILISFAGAVLAIAGFILSILAHIAAATSGTFLQRIESSDALATAETTSRPRDRDFRAPSPRTPRTFNDSSGPSGDRSQPLNPSRGRRVSRAPSPTPPQSPPLGDETPSPAQESERGNICRRRPLRRTTRQTSLDTASPASPVSAPSDTSQMTVGDTTAVQRRQPLRTFSDLSSNQSSELTAVSEASEHSPLPGHQVLRKLKERHSHLRERCLVRAQSMPMSRPPARPAPARRTDPYQAPYFFPTPMSPEAETYLQEVVRERHGAPSQLASEPYTTDSTVVIASPPSSPSQNDPEKAHQPSPPSPPARPAARQPAAGSRDSQRRHRWSWHLPLHHQSGERARSAEGARQEKGGVCSEHKEVLTKLKFGHHRRRNGTGSEDVRTTTRPS